MTALVVIVLVGLVAYAVWCALDPWVACWWCRGSGIGRSFMSTGTRYHHKCRVCHGERSQYRLGVRIVRRMTGREIP